jgi:hypothetical protein
MQNISKKMKSDELQKSDNEESKYAITISTEQLSRDMITNTSMS